MQKVIDLIETIASAYREIIETPQKSADGTAETAKPAAEGDQGRGLALMVRAPQEPDTGHDRPPISLQWPRLDRHEDPEQPGFDPIAK